ncbi:hypothetical protein B0H19DRAFT_1130672 [Mycena capillaripes]|nr:hypothetical protein B0H19DRAFT_1130672 [Mycena capillaripes]
MMPTLRSVLTVLSLAAINVSAQTLYDVSVNIPSATLIREQSLSISVGGTNANGATTYIEVIALAAEIQEAPSTTFTVISVPTTIPHTQTLVADASGETIFNGDAVETCGFGADGRGTCVEGISVPMDTQSVVFSGSVVPFYTLPATPSATTPSAAQRSTTSFTLLIVLPVIGAALMHAI